MNNSLSFPRTHTPSRVQQRARSLWQARDSHKVLNSIIPSAVGTQINPTVVGLTAAGGPTDAYSALLVARTGTTIDSPQNRA